MFTGAAEPAHDAPPVLGETRVDGGEIVFEPRFPFVAGLRYRARFQPPGGGAVVERVFEVPEPHGEPPRVVGLFPSDAVLPANTLRMYVHFSQPMEPRDAARHVHLLDDRGEEVPLPFVEIEPGLWDPRNTRLTLLFHPGRLKRGVSPGEAMGPPLREGGRYRIVIDGGLRNGRGQRLTVPFEKPFGVGPADRTSPRLDGLRVEAPQTPQAPLVVALPEPLDAGLLRRLLWVEDPAGRRLPGTIEIESAETLWRFRPERPWQPGVHALRIHPALEDRAGNRFDRLFDRDLAAAEPPAAPEAYRVAFSARLKDD